MPARRAHNIFDSGAIAKQYVARLNSDIRSLQSKSCAVILITTPHSPWGGNFLRCVPAAELPRQEASERVIGAAVVHARRDFASHAPFPFYVFRRTLSCRPMYRQMYVDCMEKERKKNKYSSKRKTQFYPLKPPSKMSSGLIKIPHYNGDWQTRRRKRLLPHASLPLRPNTKYNGVCAPSSKKPLQIERERARLHESLLSISSGAQHDFVPQ
jgi:hypothetical protein